MQQLTAPPRAGFTEQQVQDSLAWQHSTRLRWGVDLLDTASHAETGITLSATDASVSWQWRAHPNEGESPVAAQVRRSATLRYRHRPGFNPLAVLYRIWVEMDTPAGDFVRWHLGVFVSVMPPFEYQGHADHNGALVFRPLDLADRSHIWQQHETEDPVMVEDGTDVITWVRDELATRFKEIDTSGVVGGVAPTSATEDYVFDAGTPWLSVYSTVLGAIGNEPLHADADGMPRSRPLEDPELRDPEHFYSFGTTVLAPISVEAVNPDLPNVIRFVARRLPSLAEEGNGIRTITNDATGPGSIQQRGRQVLMRVEVDAQDQETLDAQARALAPFYFAGGGLRAMQEVGLNPRHDDSDVVFLEKPAVGISGTWLVTAWDIQLGDVDQMRTMRLELEQLTGAAFAPVAPATIGAFGTYMFGALPFGGAGFGAAGVPPPPPPPQLYANLLTDPQADVEGTL